MKNRQTTILYVLLCCACLFSCQRDNTTKLLELAEAQIWENPDSTLQILEQIPSPEITALAPDCKQALPLSVNNPLPPQNYRLRVRFR